MSLYVHIAMATPSFLSVCKNRKVYLKITNCGAAEVATVRLPEKR